MKKVLPLPLGPCPTPPPEATHDPASSERLKTIQRKRAARKGGARGGGAGGGKMAASTHLKTHLSHVLWYLPHSNKSDRGPVPPTDPTQFSSTKSGRYLPLPFSSLRCRPNNLVPLLALSWTVGAAILRVLVLDPLVLFVRLLLTYSRRSTNKKKE